MSDPVRLEAGVQMLAEACRVNRHGPGICSADDSSKNSRCNGRCAGPIFCCRQGRGSAERGSGRPIPPLVSKIQVATTNAGARAEGGLTPDFLALS